jgi:hypothetical protein
MVSDLAPHWYAYSDAMRRGDHEEAARVLDQNDVDEIASFVAFLRDELGRPDQAERYIQKMKEIDSGRYGARNTWRSISATQRRALLTAFAHGGRFERVGKEYRHRDRNQPRQPVRVATLRNLCSRDLFAWDGTVFDPEAVAVLTERGRFVIEHGPTTDPTRKDANQ